MNLNHKLFFLFFAVVVCKKLPAQQPYFQEESSQSATTEIKHVNGMAADVNNCVWLTTQTGIYRYDGSHFRHYSVLNTPELKFERMTGTPAMVDEDSYGWCIQDGKSNLYEIDAQSRIRSLSITGTNKLVASTISFTLMPPPGKTIDEFTYGHTQTAKITPHSKTCFILLTSGAVARTKLSDLLSTRPPALIYTDTSVVTGTEKVAVSESRFYLATRTALLRWSETGQQPVEVQFTGDITRGPVDLTRFGFLRSSNSAVLLIWHNGNIYEATEQGSNVLYTRLLVTGDPSEMPLSVFYAPRQGLFMSYYSNRGLLIYRPRHFSIAAYSDPKNPARDDYYYSVLPYGDGMVSINNTGLVQFGLDGTTKVLDAAPLRKYFIFKDSKGNIWYQGSNNDGMLNCLEAATGKIIPVVAMGFKNVFCGMYQQDDSSFFVLTDRNLNKLSFNGKQPAGLKLLFSLPVGADFNMLFHLNEHELWLGTDRGLMQYDYLAGSMKRVTEIANVYVRSAVQIEPGNYLLGTFDKGIYRYLDGKWSQLANTGKRMPGSAHGFIIDDATASVWVSSNEGVIRMPLRQLQKNNSIDQPFEFAHFTNFGSGIPAEFNGSSNVSAAKLSDTCFVFANAKGLVFFNPRMMNRPPLPVNVLAETLNEYNGEPLTAEDSDLSHLQFRPIVPYFGDRGDLEVMYRLTNSDDNWHSLSPSDFITYNNVSPGNHQLQFRLRYYNDPEGKEVLITAKEFKVPHRWYQTLLFKIAAIILAILLLVALHNFRLWLIIKKKKELSAIVDRKTKELQETNDNLSEVIRELSDSETNLRQSNFMKDRYYAVLTHDLRSPLKFLSFNIGRMLEQLPAQEPELKKGLHAAYECSTEVHKLIDEFVCWIQENEHRLTITPENVSIENVIDEIRKIYAPAIVGNGNRLITSIEPGLQFRTDPRIIFVVLRNAIDNANKYTHDGKISVSAKQVEGQLLIAVEDNGRGMKDEMVQELTELQEESGLHYKERKSLGFYIMAILTKRLGGTYAIKSSGGKGTALYFKFPELKQEIK